MIWFWLAISYVISLNFNIFCFRRVNKESDDNDKLETSKVLFLSLCPIINFIISILWIVGLIFMVISESRIFETFDKWIQGE